MKRVLQFALAAMMFLAACSKEDLTPPPLSQEQEVQEATTVVENAADDGYITLEDARKDLESILADFSTLSKSGNGGFPARKIADGFTLKSTRPSISKSTGVADTAKIHVFNFEDNSGFAIMSATTEMPSLLAITEGGNIDTNEVIEDPGLTMFLANLEAKLAPPTYKQHGIDDPIDSNGNKVHIEESRSYPEYTNKIYNPVGGYCKVHWEQGFPYNIYCTTINGDTSVTGCVATACAQLMSVYKYPDSYHGYRFNWNDMISGKNTENIARLMQQLGLKSNLNVTYGIQRSGADPANIPRTLENFGYSNGGTLKSYNKDEVVSELIKGYCVLLGGYTDKKTHSILGIVCDIDYTGGHRWLLHGVLTRTKIVKTTRHVKYLGTSNRPEQDYYQEGTIVEHTDYILCNFGWGNYYYNGYYFADVFDVDDGPEFAESISKSTKENCYQYKLTAVVGIRK